MNDNIFKNKEFLESLSEKLEEQKRILEEPLRLVAEQFECSGIAQYADVVSALPVPQIAAVTPNFLGGVNQIENMYGLLNQVCDNITAIETMMSTRFKELVQPIHYLSESNSVDTVTNGFSSAISNLVFEINTSWIQCVNPWQTKISGFVSYDLSVLNGIDSAFSRLIIMEQDTAKFLLTTDCFSEITSVTVQLASIQKSFSGMAKQWRNMIAPFTFLEEYSHFAFHQHQMIQKAVSINDDKSVKWRLDLLRATSKFIDRQITWANDLASEVQEDIEDEDIPVVKSELDITAIPQYIGYSKRDSKAVDDALADSIITIITEKGKLIVQKARLIQILCRQSNREMLFQNVELYISSYMVLGETFCNNSVSLQIIIDALYQLFYEQRKNIASYIDLEKYSCIDQIKKMKDEESCSRNCKEISSLQNTLYDQFIKLEDSIIDNLEDGMLSCQPPASITTILEENIWSEENLNMHIFRALQLVQCNRVYYDKKENELNDGVRDELRMIYEIKDQTRQGSSSGGKDAGEIDLLICRHGFPVAIVEGLKVDSLRREYIQDHIDKVLTYYDPAGCPYVYIIIYAAVKKFALFWENCFKYIKEEYNYPFKIKEELREINHMYTNSKHAKAVICREDINVSIHFFAVLVK